MVKNSERTFSPIKGPWDLRTQYPVTITSSSSDDDVVKGHFDFDKMSIVKKDSCPYNLESFFVIKDMDQAYPLLLFCYSLNIFIFCTF